MIYTGVKLKLINAERNTGGFMKIDDNFGSQQLLKDILPNVRTIDIRIRMDAQYYWFEGDYLKKILRNVEYNQIDNDGIKGVLEDHKQIEKPEINRRLIMSQQNLMKFDPATGESMPFPSHAQQYRDYHGGVAWLFCPWTGSKRSPEDIGSDVHGVGIVSELPLMAAN